MKKIVIISGPTGAGKDALVEAMYRELEQVYSGKVSKAEYFKTREPRPEERADKYFISEQEFLEKRRLGEIPDEFYGQVGSYWVGYDVNEFKKSEIVIVNIDDRKARTLKERVQGESGEAMTIFLHAPEENRRLRYRLREGLLFEEEAQYRIDHDVTDPNPENHEDFDLVIENKEDRLKETVAEVMPKVREFIES